VFLASIFLLQRPEKKRQAARLQALEGMKKGDKVISASGIHGVVSRMNKDRETVFVTVAKDVDLEFSKSVLTLYEEPKEDTKKGEVADDAKRLEDSRKKVKA
ncbi:MAG: preprotein translocase subunit YajC, partial [Candidatus Sumerlaeota bacterium]